MSLLCGVDIGTSSSKGVLVRPDGTVAATASREHGLSVPRPGWAEHDAEGWWRDFVSITRELTAAAGEPVAGVAVSGIGRCVLPADSEGTPLRQAILYGIDTRAAAEIYEPLYHLYRDLYPATRRHAHTLAALQLAGTRPSS